MNEHQPGGQSVAYLAHPKTDKSLVQLATDVTPENVGNNTDLIVLDRLFAYDLIQATAERINPLQAVYDRLSRVTRDNLGATFGIGNRAWYHELNKPFALYNWEIGLHAVLLAVDRFFSTQQFEVALQIARLVFDHTADFETQEPPKAAAAGGKSGTKTEEVEKPVMSCWRFPPFREIATEGLKRGEVPVNLSIIPAEVDTAASERHSHSALVHATARGRPTAYMKWIIMRYVEILVASGDVHFRQGTLESLPLATQRYIEAAHFLRPKPPHVPKLGKPVVRTFKTSVKGQVDFELSLPFSCYLKERGSETKVDTDSRKQRQLGFVRSGYFWVPLNPQFKKMRDLVNERLFNIQNSLDIQGRHVTYSVLEPSIDPGALVALSKLGSQGVADGLKMIIGDRDSPMPSYRFEYVLCKALEICTELRSMGERFLSAIEKKEAEAINVLSARYTPTIQNMMLDVKDLQMEELVKTIDSMYMTRDSQESQLQFYLALIGESGDKVPSRSEEWQDIAQDIEKSTEDELRFNSYEKMEMNLSTVAAGLNVTATAIDAASAPMHAIPSITTNAMPIGVGVSISAGGANIANTMSVMSNVLKMGSIIATEAGARAARKAQLTRQLQEKRLQANIRGREIKAQDKQIEIQEMKLRINAKEIEV
ncbi:hypothetical protein MMC21_007193 [Puttea exsequens]|nr:hypothetical protein [Puttea exsequens]